MIWRRFAIWVIAEMNTDEEAESNERTYQGNGTVLWSESDLRRSLMSKMRAMGIWRPTKRHRFEIRNRAEMRIDEAEEEKESNEDIQIDKEVGSRERKCWERVDEWCEESNCTPAESPLEFIVFTEERVLLDLLTWSTLLLTRNQKLASSRAFCFYTQAKKLPQLPRHLLRNYI